MISSINSLNTIKYTIDARELIDNRIIHSKTRVKLQINPFFVYNYTLEPREGIEVLFTYKNEKAIINPNGFPFFNLNLDPYSKIMRNNQHHTIHETGFRFLGDIFYSLLDDIKKDPNKYIVDLGLKEHSGKECKVLKLHNPNFKLKKYIVQENEDIQDIATSYNLSSYLILIKNNLDFYNDIGFGDTIIIPNTYAESFEVWIDLKSKLPVVQKIYVDNKLFEHYEFSNIKINPVFNKEEYLKNYREYNF